ncbi:MAG TPA: ABC transporter substrate-binding protein [Terracidiphilus sp.]|nr:ABC transporter substrate-binding protein [Terracidiphilus sp.]
MQMGNPKIVSFLPAATEMVYALGLGDQLVGVSHECDFPAEARTKPVVVRPALPIESMSLCEIDAAVAERIGSGGSLYQVDEALLGELKPDLILTQNLCQVCAASGNDLASALKVLDPAPEIVWMSPHSLTEILENVRELGRVTGTSSAADTLIESCRARLENIAEKTRGIARRPRVFCMEWADPVYCAGHWVGEMVEIAGGTDELARQETDSVRIPWADVVEWSPEVIIFSPCGFSLEKALEQVGYLESQLGWTELPAVRNQRVFAVDANSYFARPGPRVVEGTELLAHLIHPELFGWNGPVEAFRAIASSNNCASKVRMKTCPECGEAFECKMGDCWCDKFPVLPLAGPPNSDCMCPECLANALKVSSALE